MVNSRLYLPKEWTGDKKRCKKAGIPQAEQLYRTKAELALAMIEEMRGEIQYDWVGGDSIDGNSKGLRQALQRMEQLFVMDVSEDLLVYTQDPKPYIPASKAGKGRKKSSYVSDLEPLKVKDLKKQLTDFQWKTYTVRKGTKGPLIRKVQRNAEKKEALGIKFVAPLWRCVKIWVQIFV